MLIKKQFTQDLEGQFKGLVAISTERGLSQQSEIILYSLLGDPMIGGRSPLPSPA